MDAIQIVTDAVVWGFALGVILSFFGNRRGY